MLGKASEIQTKFIDASFVSELQRDINLFLSNKPGLVIIDIRHLSVVDNTSENGIFHTAMIIYREESA